MFEISKFIQKIFNGNHKIELNCCFILFKTLNKQDKDEKIMDAKVMRKGDQKLIIVDVPNPKQRWMKPETKL